RAVRARYGHVEGPEARAIEPEIAGVDAAAVRRERTELQVRLLNRLELALGAVGVVARGRFERRDRDDAHVIEERERDPRGVAAARAASCTTVHAEVRRPEDHEEPGRRV